MKRSLSLRTCFPSRRLGWLALATCGLGACSDEPAADPPATCETLESAITRDRLETHLRALEAIAIDAHGTRAAGTPGFDASADYVRDTLEAAGYEVTFTEPFTFLFNAALGDSLLEIQTDPAITFQFDSNQDGLDADFMRIGGAAPGDITGPLEPIDLQLGSENTSTSGCDDEDFASFTAGTIALIQRGECAFGEKIKRAEDAGAIAVILFNQGDTADRTGLLRSVTIRSAFGESYQPEIPAVFTTYEVGTTLANLDPNTSVRLFHNVVLESRPAYNIVIETPGGDADSVLMVGAHLDSVTQGPGINDNGSGSAALLALAEGLTACPEPTRKIRIAWWGAEEFGLLGSQNYVNALSTEAIDRIDAYLNFDMVGSPNPVHFNYSGQSTNRGVPEGERTPNPGALAIETWFSDDFSEQSVPLTAIDLGGSSDHYFFDIVGVPTGGLFTGASSTKSADEAMTFGGTANEPYDPCYHLYCDTVDNIDFDTLELMAHSAARAVNTFGFAGDGLTFRSTSLSHDDPIAALGPYPGLTEVGGSRCGDISDR